MKNNTPPMFIADCHLGKLAKYLRMMGFDTLYFSTIDDNDLIDLACEQERLILTRDRDLHEREKAPTFYLTPTDNLEQLQALQDNFNIKSYKLKARCIVCNTQLDSIEKSQIIERIPEKVKAYFTEFDICSTCSRIYWKGGHFKRMQTVINAIK